MDLPKMDINIPQNPSEELAEIRKKIDDLNYKTLQNDDQYERINQELLIAEDDLVKMRLDVTVAQLQRDVMLQKLREVEDSVANKSEELQKIFDEVQDKMDDFNKEYSNELMEHLLKGVSPIEASHDPETRKKKLEAIRRKGRLEGMLFYKKFQERILNNLRSDD